MRFEWICMVNLQKQYVKFPGGLDTSVKNLPKQITNLENITQAYRLMMPTTTMSEIQSWMFQNSYRVYQTLWQIGSMKII